MKESSLIESNDYLEYFIKENLRNTENPGNPLIEKQFKNESIFIVNLKSNNLSEFAFKSPEELEKDIQSLINISKANRRAIEYLVFTLKSLSQGMNLSPIRKFEEVFKKINLDKFQEFSLSSFKDTNYFLLLRTVKDDENSFYRSCYLNYLHYIISIGKVDLFIIYIESNKLETLKFSYEKFHECYEYFLKGLKMLSEEYKESQNSNNVYIMLFLVTNLFPYFDKGGINFIKSLIL